MFSFSPEPLILASNIKQEHRLRVFGQKRHKEATGGWRKLQKEELHNMYPPLSIMKILNSGR
jgi:hypothetical protein